ncbi:alkyl hydroperoxide reductase subunit C [Fusobacterium perfoetens]|uniref:alkyl hydroperoxide reductase subunit C n=1 Tax=Fusobacterium perfoetens TaxID=852 RepID=UPI00047F0F5E|nr:alkyl hydroperoxide reductase subunit C [Fusobacterium perfoetens]MCI6152552.1 alkyl hydroperoxide reductase subunit C [Fusobacterium perfoetens]MDY3237560.1 alkyl hydroperoxide reductase subunit C [Fusobacterium perfoetens]
MSLIGKKVEEFKAKGYQNGDFIEITNESMKGKWAAVVFYPADFTFVCPTELEDLANLYEEFKKEGCEVYSVSTDTEFVHKAWHDTSERIKKVQYPMIADPTGKLSRAFEVMIEEEGLALRGSFIIDPEGVIQAYEVHANGIGREASELLRKLQAAKFVREHGEVCPAKWKPGKESLKPSIDLVGKL